MNRHASSAIIVSVLFSLASNVVIAQDSAEEIDSVISDLDANIRQAEQTIFRLFNANNSSNRFDIRCQSLKATDSHIPKRVCAPSFVRQDYKQYAEILPADFHILRDQVTWSVDMGDEMREFWMEFTDLVFRNNDFAYAVVEFGTLLEVREEGIAALSSL
ncbi:MAG: hypothetical protein GKR91_18450 [Pseudomonadales bacterium]|nr:hypothetical protein [Pseudomonadales bacterium]